MTLEDRGVPHRTPFVLASEQPAGGMAKKNPADRRSVAAVVSCFCFITVAAVIVLGLWALFLLFVVVLVYERCYMIPG